ncbi:hypothetical protein BDZ89DRAFT_1148541 [Hymenopellis radicata]|nr:hypothetical protein BDZ89DRAFT_1148541 [Hymenopellis radicata]
MFGCPIRTFRTVIDTISLPPTISILSLCRHATPGKAACTIRVLLYRLDLERDKANRRTTRCVSPDDWQHSLDTAGAVNQKSRRQESDGNPQLYATRLGEGGNDAARLLARRGNAPPTWAVAATARCEQEGEDMMLSPHEQVLRVRLERVLKEWVLNERVSGVAARRMAAVLPRRPPPPTPPRDQPSPTASSDSSSSSNVPDDVAGTAQWAPQQRQGDARGGGKAQAFQQARPTMRRGLAYWDSEKTVVHAQPFSLAALLDALRWNSRLYHHDARVSPLMEAALADMRASSDDYANVPPLWQRQAAAGSWISFMASTASRTRPVTIGKIIAAWRPTATLTNTSLDAPLVADA